MRISDTPCEPPRPPPHSHVPLYTPAPSPPNPGSRLLPPPASCIPCVMQVQAAHSRHRHPQPLIAPLPPCPATCQTLRHRAQWRAGRAVLRRSTRARVSVRRRGAACRLHRRGAPSRPVTAGWKPCAGCSELPLSSPQAHCRTSRRRRPPRRPCAQGPPARPRRCGRRRTAS